MSAYMVDKTHIDVLVRAGLDFGVGQAASRLRWWTADPNAADDAYAAGIAAGGDSDAAYKAYLAKLEELRRELTPETADATGAMLVQANLDSIHARYPDTVERPEGTPGPLRRYWEEPYVFTNPGFRPTPEEALAALRGYEYQACEHRGWRGSEAWWFVEALTSKAIGLIPAVEKAPWHWTPDKVRERRDLAWQLSHRPGGA